MKDKRNKAELLADLKLLHINSTNRVHDLKTDLSEVEERLSDAKYNLGVKEKAVEILEQKLEESYSKIKRLTDLVNIVIAMNHPEYDLVIADNQFYDHVGSEVNKATVDSEHLRALLLIAKALR